MVVIKFNYYRMDFGGKESPNLFNKILAIPILV